MEIKDYLTTRNYTKSNNRKIQYIVIHYVGAVSSALNNAKYFKTTYRGASAHYFVDEKDIYRVVEDKNVAWHCGANTYKHSKCRNTNSIGIEMCCYNNNGVTDVSEKVVERTIELTKELMAKYNIPAENVLRHYDVTGKNCPAPMVADVKRWTDFKSRLEEKIDIKYEVHIENIGWQEEKENGELAGTEGQALRIEAVKIHADIPIQYRVHMADKGWGEYVSNSCMAGTVGEARRIEAIEIISSKNKIKATAHIEGIGNAYYEEAAHLIIGTEGRALRLEALRLEFV